MRLTVILLLVFLLVTSALAGTLIDDFGDGDLKGWTPVPGDGETRWEIQDKALVGRNFNAFGGSTLGLDSSALRTNSWSDYTFTCRFRVDELLPGLNTDWHVVYIIMRYSSKEVKAIVFHFPVRGKWYLFRYPIDGGPGAGFANGESEPLKLGEWYSFKGIVQGKMYQIFLQNEKKGEIVTPHSALGSVGLGVRNIQVTFDDVVITGPDVPDMNMKISSQSKIAITWSRLKR